MATIVINVPDAVATRVRDAIATYHNYDENKLPVETKTEFAQRMIRTEVKSWVIAAEARVAGHAADRTARQAAEADIQLT